MKRSRVERIAFIAALSLAALVLACDVSAAQNVQGVINGRSGATMTLQTRILETWRHPHAIHRGGRS